MRGRLNGHIGVRQAAAAARFSCDGLSGVATVSGSLTEGMFHLIGSDVGTERMEMRDLCF